MMDTKIYELRYSLNGCTIAVSSWVQKSITVFVQFGEKILSKKNNE
jgi:hypothetical protein